ncbi:MAG: enterochelin esterase-like enzyme [Gemmatimonadota bacterium]|nr:MAG: enterochelin esterase-like enzyme [Gemmatimonadota bacterium]
MQIRPSFLFLAALLALGAPAVLGFRAATVAEPVTFEVRLSRAAALEIERLGLTVPAVGRVFVIVARSEEQEPRRQVGVTGVPFWGIDVRDFGALSTVTLDWRDESVTGYPLRSFDQLPPGEYFVQAFLSVYTRFERSDGHTVEMHLNSGAGQNLWYAPGNAYSEPQRVVLDPDRGGPVELRLTQVIAPIEPLRDGEVLQQGNPRDTEWVKFVKIRSELLSEFWGHDMYIGANVLVPRGFAENSDRRYPVIYMQGHFPGRRAPLGFRESAPGGRAARLLYDYWLADESPQVLAVTFREANPFYDTSYDINSANMGPSGDAVVRELIPHIERTFRGIGEPWARVLAGGSTGGWEALALQVFYPDDFSGTWAWCPDPVDFHYYQIVNIYEDRNAYFTEYEWVSVERPNSRRPDGNIRSTVRQENLYELAKGPNSRSGGQWAVWEALFGPVGADGYPQPIWDMKTGVIDRAVAEYWREHYDINHYLQQNWATVGPKLHGKIHVATGDMDSYYLNEAVYLLQEFLDSATDPPAEATFEYGWRRPHCFIGYSPTRPERDLSYAEFVEVAADHMWNTAPPGADLRWWRR